MDKKARWNERYASSKLTWSAGPNALFAELAAGLPVGHALDVASGEGRNALWLAEEGWQVDAIDFSEVGIEKGRQIAEKRQVDVNWIVGDVSAHDYPAGFYDLVAVLYLHTSEEERNSWLPSVARSVKPGGSLIYIAHDPSNIELGVGGPQDASLLPALEELEGYFENFDFKRAEIFKRPVQNDPGHGGPGEGIALDTLLWAVRH